MKKKVPDAAEVTYKYNDKDLLGGYQDGHLSGLNQWYTYHYDNFGREIRQGFFSGTPTTSFDPTDPQIKTTYGSNSYDKDKVKTVETKILGTSTWLSTTNTYNTCGIVSSQSGNNHANTTAGSVTNTFTYDGAFNVTKTVTTIDAFSVSKTITNTQTYDQAGRPEINKFKVSGFESNDRIMNRLYYNAEDEVYRKFQGRTDLSGNLSYLQRIDYYYKNHGPLYRINVNNLYGTQQETETCTDPNPADPGANYSRKDLFYLELFYNTKVSGTDAVIQYNGNIANAVWQVRGREQGVYSYQYDDYNRLTQARYYDRQNGTLTQSDRYTCTYEYDDRGNFTRLTRNGMYDAGGCTSQGEIDDLDYTYFSNSNQLKTVRDYAPSASRSAGFQYGWTTDYKYDPNGTQRKNRAWKTTTNYNHLDLPTSILFDGTNKKIEFTYDAAGNLLTRKVLTGTTINEQRDYVSGIEYVKYGSGASLIESIPHSEGRVFYTNGANPRYEYVIQDHLGNTRLLYSDLDADGQIETPEEILWEGHYYPYGMEMRGPWMDKPEQETNYKYNGIEKEDHHGLNLNIALYRTLDPTVGQWQSVDPRGELLSGMSPYQAMGNNPVSFNDPNGDFIPAMVFGAAIGVLSNGLNNSFQGNPFFAGAGKAAFLGAYGGAFSFGAGQITQSVFGAGGSIGKSVFQAGVHGLGGGINSTAAGGNFGSGFLGAAVSSGISSAAHGSGNLGIIAAGGLSGGIGSLLGGGDFWVGVGQGLITSALNHAAHNGLFGDNIAAAMVTQRLRHIIAPDASSAGVNVAMAAGLAIDIEAGGILIIRGSDVGKIIPFADFGAGGGLDASLSLKATKFYYSGKVKHFTAGNLKGIRTEFNISLNLLGLRGTYTAAYAPQENNQFVLMLGRSAGLSGLPSPFQGNLNRGTTDFPKFSW